MMTRRMLLGIVAGLAFVFAMAATAWTQGKPAVKVLADGWTAVTRDGSLSAHFEHTIAITEKEPRVLTALPA